MLLRLLQSVRTKIVVPSLKQSRRELKWDERLNNRHILSEQLLLQVNRIGANDRFLSQLLRRKSRRHQIGQTLARARPSLHHQMLPILNNLRHSLRHFCLPRPRLISLRFSQLSPIGKEFPHSKG